MSQIIFRHEGKRIMTGYDRPLNYVHFTVFDAAGEVVYSELDHKGFDMTVEDVMSALAIHEIPAPPELLPLLKEHVARKAGNEVVVLPLP